MHAWSPFPGERTSQPHPRTRRRGGSGGQSPSPGRPAGLPPQPPAPGSGHQHGGTPEEEAPQQPAPRSRSSPTASRPATPREPLPPARPSGPPRQDTDQSGGLSSATTPLSTKSPTESAGPEGAGARVASSFTQRQAGQELPSRERPAPGAGTSTHPRPRRPRGPLPRRVPSSVPGKRVTEARRERARRLPPPRPGPALPAPYSRSAHGAQLRAALTCCCRRRTTGPAPEALREAAASPAPPSFCSLSCWRRSLLGEAETLRLRPRGGPRAGRAPTPGTLVRPKGPATPWRG
ncbi:basic salivary proline-rich protein 1-like [Neopsephotus bourkii]|uniref:basic salivary proline-rich protein 1-like n=1 Tax=Neopsephotus bourkii TaxID=309878 RepID=UPI002AA5380F|nr:basic salivary proline-rich protein 1-like [Neopsephotus bourkii]